MRKGIRSKIAFGVVSLLLVCSCGVVSSVAGADSTTTTPVSATTPTWGSTGGTFTPAPGSSPGAVPGVGYYCTTLYYSGTGNYYNQSIVTASCAGLMSSIYVTALLYSKGGLVAQSSGYSYATYFAGKTANKNCTSAPGCTAGNAYTGFGEAVYTPSVVGYWTHGPGCSVIGIALVCALAFGPWNW